jgi:DNA-binding response OmpR family regulator
MSDLPSKKILVVEDEKLIAKPLAKRMQLFGFEVKNAFDGEEALAMLGKEKFDLVLLDLMMPKVDGFDVLTAMKAKGDATPVIVATNLNEEKDISRVMSFGVANYYVKSDTALDEIIERIKITLGIT